MISLETVIKRLSLPIPANIQTIFNAHILLVSPISDSYQSLKLKIYY